MRSDENALFSFSSNLGVDRNDSFTKLGVHRIQGDKTPTSEEPPHEENSLDEILQRRGLRSSTEVPQVATCCYRDTALHLYQEASVAFDHNSRAYDANITKRI